MSVVNVVSQINPGGSTAYRPQSGADEAFDLESLLAGRDAARSENEDKKGAPAPAGSAETGFPTEAAEIVTAAQARDILKEVTAAAGRASLETLVGWHEIGRPSLLGSAYI
jgi:hypothetical protein